MIVLALLLACGCLLALGFALGVGVAWADAYQRGRAERFDDDLALALELHDIGRLGERVKPRSFDLLDRDPYDWRTQP